jgi:cyclopropane fatty-acyl-phospholipid synthase-like methyltransferase
MGDGVRKGSEPPNASDEAMRAFREQWAVYRKLVENNYLSHREVRGVLHRELAEGVGRAFRFLDLACGDATMTVAALGGTGVTEYHGIDLSRPALEMAEQTVRSLSCPVRLEQQDFVAAIRERTELADVVYIGLSLHHLVTPAEKRDFMRAVRAALGDGGLFLIFEPASLEGETRASYLERYEKFIEADWTALSPAERNILWTHVRTCDFPEQPSTWLQLGHDAGFTEVTDLFTDAPKFAKVISYRP